MSLSSGNESSDEFYDAEEGTPHLNLNRKRGSKTGTPLTSTSDASNSEFKFPEPLPADGAQKLRGLNIRGSGPRANSESGQLSIGTLEGPPSDVRSSFGRQRFRDLRRCMQFDEDENPGHVLTPDSQNSSVEGIFPQQKSHPFRIIESDAMSVQSMVSLGKVGRILAGNIEPSDLSVGKDLNIPANPKSQLQSAASSGTISSSSSSTATSTNRETSASCQPSQPSTKSGPGGGSISSALPPGPPVDSSSTRSAIQIQGGHGSKMICHEPDVIASAKLVTSKKSDKDSPASTNVSGEMSGPVAPPRRRKKDRKTSTSSSDQLSLNNALPKAPNEKMCLSTEGGHSFAGMENSVSTLLATEPLQRPSDLALFRDSARNDSASNSSRGVLDCADVISRHSGHSSSSVLSTKPTSPTNSTKNISVARGSSQFDQSQGMSLYKVIHGNTADLSAGRDPFQQLDRFERIRAEIMSGVTANAQKGTISGATVPRGLSVGTRGTGSNSLGSATKYAANLEGHLVNVERRRKSAGDEDLMKQMNVYLRTRTGSGKNLTDMEILSQVPVKNLDTGENFPLSAAEENIPVTDLNPLSLHILRLTSHMEMRESDEESVCGSSRGGVGSDITIPAIDDEEGETEEGGRLRRKTAKLRRFFGSTVRKTVDKAKSIASEVSHARHKEDVADIVDVMNPEQNIKIKASSSNKGPYEFTKLQHVQDLGDGSSAAGANSAGNGTASGAVWCMKFSSCGRLLATAGQDKVLKIWVLKDAYPFFQDMRTKYNAEQKASPTPSQESLVSHNSAEEALAMAAAADVCSGPFMPRAFCTYTGHTSDLLDVAWSKNYFILSSSMDKTVRLWHISRRECLCSFQHIDFVTAIAFHPRDDRFFLSGSLDGKLRLWNIPDKKVALYTELNGPTKLITAANFCQNGKFAVVGSYDGRCIFYTTDQLRYHTMVHVRSSRGRNKTARKISGIEPMPGEDKILVTSNDSRVRLYDLRDLNLSCKYRGFVNASSQIKASFSHDGKYIIAGSENQCIYVWKTHNDQSKLGSGLRRDRSDYWEGIKAHNATVTCAIFAPHPEAIIKPETDDEIADSSSQKSTVPPDPMVEQHKKGCGYVMVSADYNGAIKIFINKTKPKHSSLPYTAILD